MKHLLPILVAAIGISSSATAQGLAFETGDWKSVISKAQKEKKLVYADVYTTWCGPCKMLATTIFPQKAAGDKYNALFVNYRIDAEKGEGIALAKKYAVDGYPTHLFIDPENEQVVYRDMGASDDVKDFNHEADVAEEERKDPNTWEKLSNDFKHGKKDTAFLRTYLTKAKRLNKNNDAILDAYIAKLDTSKMTMAQLDFLAENIQTYDNNAVPVFYAHRKELDQKHTDWPGFSAEHLKMWTYTTFEKAVANRDEAMLEKIAKAKLAYIPDDNGRENYWYKTQYFTKLGDEDGWKKAAITEGDFLTAVSVNQYAQEDKNAQDEVRKKLRAQLKMMKVPDSNLDARLQLNFERNPSRLHPSSTLAAAWLNDIAWHVYEQYPKDEKMMKLALGWSSRSVDLTQESADMMPSFADTYAHLLYVSGQKPRAIMVQTKAIDALKTQKGKEDERKQLEETLQKMQADKL